MMRSLIQVFGAGLAPLRTKAAVGPIGVRDFFGPRREPFPGAWQRGVAPDNMQELTAFGAVYACLSLVSGDIGKLAPVLLQRQRDGTQAPAPDSSPHWIPLRDPNAFQTRNQFFRQWMLSKLMHGNTYALKQRDDRNMVARLYVLDPRRVTPMVTSEGDVYYSLGGDDLSKVAAGRVVPASEIIHDRCPTLWHPLIGVPPLYAAAMSATQGRRIQANSAKFFENMSLPSGYLVAPGTIDDVTAARLKSDFEQNFSGANIGRLAVLGDGLKFEATGTIPAEQAQLIEQLKWTAIDIAGAFLVPAYKINVGPMPTSNNVEALQQQYYESTLQQHIEDIEALLTRGLSVPTGTKIEFDLDGLLRMDSAAQVEMLAQGVGAAIFSPNEARARKNLPPVVGGHSPMIQQQNFSLSALAKRDAKDDPFDAGGGDGGGGGSGVKALSLEGPPGRDGRDGEPGRDAVHVDVLDGIDPTKRYQRGTFANHRGGILRAFRQTDPLPDDGQLERAGWHCVVRGIADDDIEVGEDLRTFTFKRTYTDGSFTTKAVTLPVIIDRGIFREDSHYERGDGATWAGSFWFAQRSTLPGEKPGDDSGAWRLSVKKGRDGRDGLRGETGQRGAEGKQGPQGLPGSRW